MIPATVQRVFAVLLAASLAADPLAAQQGFGNWDMGYESSIPPTPSHIFTEQALSGKSTEFYVRAYSRALTAHIAHEVPHNQSPQQSTHKVMINSKFNEWDLAYKVEVLRTYMREIVDGNGLIRWLTDEAIKECLSLYIQTHIPEFGEIFKSRSIRLRLIHLMNTAMDFSLPVTIQPHSTDIASFPVTIDGKTYILVINRTSDTSIKGKLFINRPLLKDAETIHVNNPVKRRAYGSYVVPEEKRLTIPIEIKGTGLQVLSLLTPMQLLEQYLQKHPHPADQKTLIPLDYIKNPDVATFLKTDGRGEVYIVHGAGIDPFLLAMNPGKTSSHNTDKRWIGVPFDAAAFGHLFSPDLLNNPFMKFRARDLGTGVLYERERSLSELRDQGWEFGVPANAEVQMIRPELSIKPKDEQFTTAETYLFIRFLVEAVLSLDKHAVRDLSALPAEEAQRRFGVTGVDLIRRAVALLGDAETLKRIEPWGKPSRREIPDDRGQALFEIVAETLHRLEKANSTAVVREEDLRNFSALLSGDRTVVALNGTNPAIQVLGFNYDRFKILIALQVQKTTGEDEKEGTVLTANPKFLNFLGEEVRAGDAHISVYDVARGIRYKSKTLAELQKTGWWIGVPKSSKFQILMISPPYSEKRSSMRPIHQLGMWPLLLPVYHHLAKAHPFLGYVLAPALFETGSLLAINYVLLLHLGIHPDHSLQHLLSWALTLLVWQLLHLLPSAIFFKFAMALNWRNARAYLDRENLKLPVRPILFVTSALTTAALGAAWSYFPHPGLWIAVILPVFALQAMGNWIGFVFSDLLDTLAWMSPAIPHLREWKQVQKNLQRGPLNFSELPVALRPLVADLGPAMDMIRALGNNWPMDPVRRAQLTLKFSMVITELHHFIKVLEPEWGKIPWFVIPLDIQHELAPILDRGTMDPSFTMFIDSLQGIPLKSLQHWGWRQVELYLAQANDYDELTIPEDLRIAPELITTLLKALSSQTSEEKIFPDFYPLLVRFQFRRSTYPMWGKPPWRVVPADGEKIIVDLLQSGDRDLQNQAREFIKLFKDVPSQISSGPMKTRRDKTVTPGHPRPSNKPQGTNLQIRSLQSAA